jgi:hypothetical protein
MDAPLSSLGEAEMLDRVGDVDILPRYAGLIQRVLEQPPGRTYEGNALAILDVTGLLANQG